MSARPRDRRGADLVLLAGRALLDPATEQPIATLSADDVWRGPDGLPVVAIAIPSIVAAARADPAEHASYLRQEADTWHAQALVTVEALAREREQFTTEDVADRLDRAPRDSRAAYSRLMVDARTRGWIELTDTDQAGTRRQSGGRRKRLWRSRLYEAALAEVRQLPLADHRRAA